MKITNINNFNKQQTPQQQSFKAGIALTVPKSLYPKNWSELDVENHFNSMVAEAIKMKPRSLVRKFLNKTGINPEVVSFMNYPGYKNIQDYLKNGKSWVEGRLNMKYGLRAPEERLDIELPDLNEDKYHFYYLTNFEKDYFIAQKPTVRQMTTDGLLGAIQHVQKYSGKEMEQEDVNFTYAVLKTLYDKQSFENASAQNFWTLEAKSLEELPETILASLHA